MDQNLSMSRPLAWFVDRLPLWLWHHGNLYHVPGGWLHFCVAADEERDRRSIRVVEFQRGDRPTRVIARGVKDFPLDHPDLEYIDTDLNGGFFATWKGHRRRRTDNQ